jgi:acylphosphatase
MRSVRLTVIGRVQGVGYRIWAERAAQSLGIRGWVRNRRDGSVELQGTGSEAATDALIEACRQGPPAAGGA